MSKDSRGTGRLVYTSVGLGIICYVGLLALVTNGVLPRNVVPFEIQVYLIPSVSVALTVTLIIRGRAKAAAARRRSAALEAQFEEEQARWREDQRRAQLTKARQDAIENSNAAARAHRIAAQFLRGAADFCEEAVTHYRAGAYSPFWSATENAAVQLGDYNSKVWEVRHAALAYKQNVSNYQHGGGTDLVPPFSVDQSDATATVAAEPVASMLRDLVYTAQRDPHYAQIWEQRRTTAAVVEGFQSMESAIGGLIQAVLASATSLTAELSTLSTSTTQAHAVVAAAVTSASDANAQRLDELGSYVRDSTKLLEQQRDRMMGWR